MKTKILIAALLFAIAVNIGATVAHADESEPNDLYGSVEEMLGELDLSEIEKYYEEIPKTFSGNVGFIDMIKGLMNGSSADYSTLTSYVLDLLSSGIKSKIPVFSSLFALMILCGIVGATKAERLGREVAEITHFAIYATIVCIITSMCFSVMEEAKSSLDKIASGVQAVFPVMLALVSVTGGATAAVYGPSAAFVSDFIIIVVEKLIFPLIICMLVLNVVSNVSKTVKLKGMTDFCGGALKWTIGLMTTVFSVFMTVKGISAGMYDGISYKAVKYTVNSSVPIVGGLVGNGFDMIIASASLIKNGLGAFAAVTVFFIALEPILEIAAFSLALKLVNAVTEPIGDGRVGEFVRSVSSVLNYVAASLIMVALVYLITVIGFLLSSQTLL
ncbi:MAG: stage III sporulation protein AE [Clostridia bacterium]|nr:stage III sporulation protein AE [Clostridia bacterium]